MDELDDQYLRWYWHEIGGTPPPKENTMRYSIELDRNDQDCLEAIREFVTKDDDPHNNRLLQAHMRAQAKTVSGVVKIALATAADEIRRM